MLTLHLTLTNQQINVHINGKESHQFPLLDLIQSKAEWKDFLDNPRFYGEKLFNALFKDAARNEFDALSKQSERTIVLVLESPELDGVAWEYAYNKAKEEYVVEDCAFVVRRESAAVHVDAGSHLRGVRDGGGVAGCREALVDRVAEQVAGQDHREAGGAHCVSHQRIGANVCVAVVAKHHGFDGGEDCCGLVCGVDHFVPLFALPMGEQYATVTSHAIATNYRPSGR